jgi:aubergine-like protein
MISNQNPRFASALPVVYKVITNTTGLSKKEIEEFTYHQCYNYFGFSGPIKVPAPLKYAEKLARYSFNTKTSTSIA